MLDAIDRLTKLSDTLSGGIESSDEHSEHSPTLQRQKQHDDGNTEGITPRTSSPKPGYSSSNDVDGVERDVIPVGSDEDDTKARNLRKRKGDSTVSALVLHKGERWSKDNIRQWVDTKKRKKLSEFVELREGKVGTGSRTALRSSPVGARKSSPAGGGSRRKVCL